MVPSDLLTVALLVALEGFLSVDNAMVLAILVLGLPKPEQRKALRYGIVGAFVFRGLATLLAVYLIQLAAVKLVGALYLFYLVVQHFGSGRSADERRTPAVARPWLGLTAFWATVVKVELTDIVFAIDSILVGVAMSSKIWVVITGGFLGIVMMRVLIGRLLTLVQRYPPLVDGAFIIIGWVAAQLVLKFISLEGWLRVEIPEWLYLGTILAIFGVSLAYGWLQERQRRASQEEQEAARLLLDEEGEPR